MTEVQMRHELEQVHLYMSRHFPEPEILLFKFFMAELTYSVN